MPINLADVWDVNSSINIALFTKNRPQTISTDKRLDHPVTGEQMTVTREFVMDNLSEDKTAVYVHMQGGDTIPLFRVSLGLDNLKEKFHLEFAVKGMLSTFFYAVNGNNMIEFDGYYNVAGVLGYGDKVALSFGFEHNSGHSGEEMFRQILSDNQGMTLAKREMPSDWVRMNPLFLALSVKPIEMIRVYAATQLPSKLQNVFPVEMRAEKWEGTENDWFKDYRFHFGLEFRYPIKNLGDFYIAGHVVLAQAGQLKRVLLENPETYPDLVGTIDPNHPWMKTVLDKSMPWFKDFSIAIGQYLTTKEGSPNLRFEVRYQWGRMPVFNYYQHRDTQSVYFGFAINR